MTSQDATPQPEPETTGIVTQVPAMSKGTSIRFGVALFVGAALWLGPLAGAAGLLIPSQLDIADPNTKGGMLGLLTGTGAVVALFANILFGGLSDITRSRWGARTPWLIVGGIVTGLMFLGLSTATTGMEMLPWWIAFQFSLNAVVAPMIATIPDRTPKRLRGTYSTVYGLGMVVGGVASQIVASRFVENPRLGFIICGVIIAFSGIAFCVIAPDRSNKGVPREKFTPRAMLQTFSFPTKGARDFYIAFFGKLLIMAAGASITAYQFFIFTDYIKLSKQETADLIAILSAVGLVIGVVFTAISGPWSDRVGRRKPFVIGAAVFVGIGTLFPFFSPLLWVMIVSIIVTGIGGAIFNAVDQALNTEVLPDPAQAAKDLGVLNVAITAGQALGPVINSIVVGITGSYQWLFPVAALITVIAGLLFKGLRGVR